MEQDEGDTAILPTDIFTTELVEPEKRPVDQSLGQRKLIRFGKSAFCITLPHSWIKKNKLHKGNILAVQETLRNSLEIIPVVTAAENKYVLSMDITDKSLDEILHLLLAAYLNGYSLITLQGPLAGKVADIRKHIREFIAAEIMEVTPQKVTINIFWDIESIQLRSIMNRIGHIIKSLFVETSELMDGKAIITDIVERGYEVQRQVLLAKRAITYALSNSATAQRFNLSAIELYYISYIIYFLGKIAGCMTEVANVLSEAIQKKMLHAKAKRDVRLLLNQALSYFSGVIETYKSPSKTVRFITSQYYDLEQSIDDFRDKNEEPWVPVVAEYVKIILMKIKDTEFVMINMENSPK